MVKTSKEIIVQAMKLAQCQNSLAFDWAFLTSILNSTYTKLYNDLMGYSNSFVRYFQFTEKESKLPDDCYKVEMVFKGKEDNPYIISQSSQNNFIPGTYYIENNTIRIVDKKDSNPVTVKYSVLPKTLTAPDNPEIIDITYAHIYGIDDDGIYYRYTDYSSDPEGIDHFYIYSFENKDSTEITVDDIPVYFNSKFDNDNIRIVRDEEDNHIKEIYWGIKDVTAYFDATDTITGESLKVMNILWDNTHMAIQYNNGDLYYMNGDFEKYKVDPELWKGRYFKVEEIYGSCGDDSTGKGFLVKSKGKLMYISFVPDTVMNYPNGVFFDIMEDMIAIQLQAICSIDNSALQTKLQNDEMSFYSSLQRSQQGIRIKNDANRWRQTWW